MKICIEEVIYINPPDIENFTNSGDLSDCEIESDIIEESIEFGNDIF